MKILKSLKHWGRGSKNSVVRLILFFLHSNCYTRLHLFLTQTTSADRRELHQQGLRRKGVSSQSVQEIWYNTMNPLMSNVNDLSDVRYCIHWVYRTYSIILFACLLHCSPPEQNHFYENPIIDITNCTTMNNRAYQNTKSLIANLLDWHVRQ